MEQSKKSLWFDRIVLSFLGLLVLIGVVNFVRPLPTASAAEANIAVQAGAANVTWPGAGQAAVGAVHYGVTATNGEQSPTPTASVAKIITALAVLQKKPLDAGSNGPDITMTDADVALYQKYAAEDGSVVQVTAGEQLNERQMLEAMLLPSGNNIADTAAVWAFGSLQNYITYANQLVGKLGMGRTTIAGDASGFLPSTVSTASDLVVLGETAIQNPVIAQIVDERTAILPVAGKVNNVDTILGTVGIQGIKTGNNDQDTGCFLSAATKTLSNGQQIVVVTAIMDEPSLQAALNDTIPLVTSTAKSFVVNTPVRTGDIVGTYKMAWGATVHAVAQKDVSMVTWGGTPIATKLSFDTIRGGKANAKVGTLTLTTANASAGTPIVLQKAVPGPSFFWHAAH